jgi:mono/diheme cytochrome c family protein
MPHNFKVMLEFKMVGYWFKGLFLFMLSVSTAFAENGAMADTIRGAMLYENHCLACHTQQIHWREKKWLLTGKA